jgi:uncharacterized protein YggE
MDGLTFRVDDPTEAERAARIAAMAQARARADTLAEAAGLAIGRVETVIEGRDGSPGDPRPKAARLLLSDSETPVQGGTTEVTVTVTVTYRIV